MTAGPVTVALDPILFRDAEREVLRYAGMTARAFRYGSGIAALRIENGAGEILVLPFRGQQVWDARFLGRRLTMRSPFEEPRDTADYLGSYGAFLLHCGLTAMGNPGPQDDHPLHGELPAARMNETDLSAGEDAEGPYLELAGRTRQTRAFSHDYDACARLRLCANATVIEVALEVTNRSARPLEVMYLAHLNFRPVDGGKILDTAADAGLALRPMPGDADLHDSALRRRLLVDPSSHRRIVAGVPIDPELVLSFRPASDREGWAHAMQLHPDGSADVVSHRPSELPMGVRWLVRDGDMDALGLVLPATGVPDGRAVAKARGEMVTLRPGGRTTFTLRVGALPPQQAAALRARIEAIRATLEAPSTC